MKVLGMYEFHGYISFKLFFVMQLVKILQIAEDIEVLLKI